MIRGLQGGEELFTRQFIGHGFLNANYEATLTPGFFSVHDDTIPFEFEAAAPVPEPGTLVLLGSGLVGAALGRRRRRT